MRPKEMNAKQYAFWVTVRRALIMITKAIDKYIKEVYSIESIEQEDVMVGEADNVSGIVEN